MSIAPQMVILTWIAFLLVVWILHRIAWKPILNALELRENRIRRALEDAAKAEQKAADVRNQNALLLEQAREESRKLIEAARQRAAENARMIEERAHAQAQQRLDEARQEMAAAVINAREALRRETAELALALAEQVMRENMASPRNRSLIEKQLERSGR